MKPIRAKTRIYSLADESKKNPERFEILFETVKTLEKSAGVLNERMKATLLSMEDTLSETERVANSMKKRMKRVAMNAERGAIRTKIEKFANYEKFKKLVRSAAAYDVSSIGSGKLRRLVEKIRSLKERSPDGRDIEKGD